MPSKHAVSVSLTEHLCHFVDEQVASGRYRTASEVVRDALRLLEAQLSELAPSAQENGVQTIQTDAVAAPTIDRRAHKGTPARRRAP